MLRLALIGFGNVGHGLAQILVEKAASLKEQYDFEARIVAVSTLRKGGLYHPDGLDLSALIAAARTGSFNTYPEAAGLVRGFDPLAAIQQSNADVVIEITYTDFNTAEPAISHIRSALELGKHVITANKGPLALAYREIEALARQQNLFFGYEGTVMGGTPTLRLAREALAGCTITGFRGIVNGTTNFILTQMESGNTYEEALAEAQQLGYAEADPTGDVEGFDALGKLIILANTIMGLSLKLELVPRKGITQITVEDIKQAQIEGKRWKLIAGVQHDSSGIQAYVRPELLPLSDPLANIGGGINAITYNTDLMGDVTLIGAGAGPQATGFALLSDLLELQRRW